MISRKLARRLVLLVFSVVVLDLGYTKLVLSTSRLDAAIAAELTPGVQKAEVIRFIHARKISIWDDLGDHVKARLTGRAENLLYRKDVVLDFKFDSQGKLSTYTQKEFLTFF